MDPLSIAASVAGLITISTQILGIIGSIKSKSSKELESLTREITASRGILCQIQGIVQFQSAKPTKSTEWLDTLNTTLDDCGDTYLLLQKDLQGLSSTSKLGSLKSKVKWTLKESDIQQILRKIESYKLSLDLLLSVQTSNTTTHIEEILTQVQGKLSLKGLDSPAVRTPLSWRKRLAGLDSGSTPVQSAPSGVVSGTNDSSSSLSTFDSSFIVPGPKTSGWHEPGIYGIRQDEGSDAPDLNSSELTNIYDAQVGRQTISLICEWESPNITNMALQPLRVHVLFKGPEQGDLYFIQLEESLSKEPIERFFAPVGSSSIIIARCDNKGSVCLLDEIELQDDKESFNLTLENFGLKSSSKAQQILVNFATIQERDTFFGHLYAIRFIQRMDFAFSMPTELYQNCVYQKRAQHIQIGYANSSEKSFIYPYLYTTHSLLDGSPMLTCAMKPNNPAVLFREKLPDLDLQIVGTETIVCTCPDGSTISNISITFPSMNELLQSYYRLQDIIREWNVIEKREIDQYTTQKEWSVGSLEFWEESINPTKAFCNMIVVISTDGICKRMRIEVFEAHGAKREKLATGFVMIHSILFFREHFRSADPDFYTFPTIQVGFWDLRDGAKEIADNFKTGQLRIRGLNESQICDELDELVDEFLAKRKSEQKRFLQDTR